MGLGNPRGQPRKPATVAEYDMCSEKQLIKEINLESAWIRVPPCPRLIDFLRYEGSRTQTHTHTQTTKTINKLEPLQKKLQIRRGILRRCAPRKVISELRFT